ncbi:MAG: trigger factor [bacterium]
MRTEQESLSGTRKKISFGMPSEEVDEEIAKYCKKLSKEVEIKGFRKGKAPSSVVRRYFREQIRREVGAQIVSTSLESFVKEQSLTPVGEPELDVPPLEEGKEFSFSVTIDVKPEIDIRDYEGVELQQEEAVVTEEEIAESLRQLQKAHAELEGISEERGAQAGEVVLVDYEGSVEGVAFSGNQKKDVYIEIGPEGARKEMEEALLGVRPGETRESEVEYPENFMNRELAGKKVLYRLTAKKLLRKVLPELDDEFAKDVGPYQGLEDLKGRLQEEVLREKRSRIRRRLEEDLLQELIQRNPFEAPRSLVTARHARMMDDARGHFLSKGLFLEEKTEGYQRLESDLEGLSEKEIKKELILDAVARKESIEVSDADVEQRLQEIARKHDQSLEKVRAEIQKQEDGLALFRRSLLNEKTLDFLLGKSKIKTVAK